MISPVVVARNQMKPLTHAFWPLGILGGCYPNAVVSGFFYCPYVIRTPYVNKHLHGWRGREHRAALHPADNPGELCARYRRRRGYKVKQDPHRMNRTLKGKLAGIARGLSVRLLTLGEPMSERKVAP